MSRIPIRMTHPEGIEGRASATEIAVVHTCLHNLHGIRKRHHACVTFHTGGAASAAPKHVLRLHACMCKRVCVGVFYVHVYACVCAHHTNTCTHTRHLHVQDRIESNECYTHIQERNSHRALLVLRTAKNLLLGPHVDLPPTL